jgi:hypothetical protein
MLLWRACNLTAFTHSSTGPEVHQFASRLPFKCQKCHGTVTLNVTKAKKLDRGVEVSQFDKSSTFLRDCSVEEQSVHFGPLVKTIVLSRPPLTQLKNICSVYPFYVYEGNRPLALKLRQRRCSLLYDVL